MPTNKEELTMWQSYLAAQKEFPTLDKDASNPHFKSTYVSLPNTVKELRPILNDHGFVVSQPVTQYNGEPAIETVIIYAPTGERLRPSGDIPPMALKLKTDDPQGQASAITYARRVALLSELGVVGDDDDDGNKANDQAKVERVVATNQPISEANKANIYHILKALEKTPEEFEAAQGPIDNLTNAQAVETLSKLKSMLARQRAGGAI